MPCDTRYETTEMQLGKLDRKVLARALQGIGYTVRLDASGLHATRYGETIAVTNAGATLTAPSYADRKALQTKVLQAYGRLASAETAKRFGFTLAKETQLEGGAVKLTFKRNMGAMGAKMKAGL